LRAKKIVDEIETRWHKTINKLKTGEHKMSNNFKNQIGLPVEA
jgi:hypothetical protein